MHGGKSSAQPAESSGSVAMTPTYVDSPRKVKGPLLRGTGGPMGRAGSKTDELRIRRSSALPFAT